MLLSTAGPIEVLFLFRIYRRTEVHTKKVPVPSPSTQICSIVSGYTVVPVLSFDLHQLLSSSPIRSGLIDSTSLTVVTLCRKHLVVPVTVTLILRLDCSKR